MKRIVCRIVLGLIVAPLLALAQAAPEKPLTPAEQMDKLFDFWNRLDQPGFGVVVVKEGQVVYQKVFGLACQEHMVPLTPDSLFNTANLGQVFLGQAVALLESRGKLNLDDDVRKLIPEVPDFGVPLRLRHLVAHTSGLRDWLPVLQLAGRGADEVTIAKVLKIVQAQKKLLFTPGERYQYSNTDYDLLAEAVRRTVGMSFSDWAFENIFRPLRMTRSVFRDNCRSILDGQAFSYNFTRQEYLRGIDNLSLTGSHSLFTSIAELGKWLVDIDAGKAFGKDVYARMFTAGKLDSGAATPAGYGVNIDVRAGRRSISQSGVWAGSEMQMGYFPDQRLGFVVLSNWDYTSVDGFGEAIPGIFLPAPAAPTAAAKPKPSAKAVNVRPALLDEYAGDYRLAPGQILTLSRSGGQLVLTFYGQRFPLTTVSENEFVLDIAQARMTFQRNKAGRVEALVWNQDGERIAPKVVLVKPSAAELAAFAGSYVNDDLGVRLVLEVRDGGLVLTPPEQAEVRLAPDEKDTFTSGSRLFPKIVFQRDAQNGVTGLIIDSAPVRDLLFKRS